MMLSGLLLVVIGLPHSYISASLAGNDPLAAILLVQSRGELASFFARPSLGDVTYAEVSAISAYLAMIGSSALSIPLLFAVGRQEGIIKLLVLANGMFLGLTFASGWFEWANTGTIDWLGPTGAEIAYLYLAFLMAEATKLSLAKRELVALPYLYAIDGVFGIVAVLIIHVGYDPSFSSLLLGPFFLVAVAVAILIVEWLLFRPTTILLTGLGLALTDSGFERRLATAKRGGWSRLKMALSEFGRMIGEGRRMAYQKRARMIDRAAAKALRQLPRPARRSRARRLDWRIVALVCAGNTLFLLLGMLLAWLLI